MNSMSGLEQTGCVHLYVGDGKGKTTAAVGLALRALGAGKRVLFCQFLKGRQSSEIAGLKELGAEIMRAKCGTKFMFQMNDEERAELQRSHMECFGKVCERILSGEADLAVLDELVDAINCGLIPEAEVTGMIKERPPGVEIVMTGRNPGEKIVEISDYHTEMKALKHPYNSGLKARNGIEY